MHDFDSQLRAFGERIEREMLEGRLNFPTVLDLSVRIKSIADDPDSSLDDIAVVVRAEPVLSAKAVRMANSVVMNPYGNPVTGVNDAVRRIGLDSLRCLAFAVAAEQVAQDFRSHTMKLIATGLWMHSVDVACWSNVIARETRAANPDTAMFAGMMVDIGQFFLLARAGEYPALEQDMDRFAEFISTWHAPVGRAILEVFGMPEAILDAFRQETPVIEAWPPTSLTHTLQIARVVSESPNPFDSLLGRGTPSLTDALAGSPTEPEALQQMLTDVDSGRRELLASLSG
ncbi:MAG: HDOD domain-containing protein [Azoarcus sp.]|nr:HDOD domain-containing protein [Azoarcus sp.]